MITIFSKKAFRFRNPNPYASILTPPEPGQKPEDAAKTVSGDAAKLGKKLDEPPFFDTVPGTMQQAPDWIKEDNMWVWAKSDGDVMEVATQDGKTVSADSLLVARQAARIKELEAQLANGGEVKGEENQQPSSDTSDVPPGAQRVSLTEKPAKQPRTPKAKAS